MSTVIAFAHAHPAWSVLIALALLVQLVGMGWGFGFVRRPVLQEQPFWWRAPLVVCWPLTWLINRWDPVQ